MDQAMVAQVRRFNRTVTERVGALQDHFLARERSLGEARVLWEIGDAGADVRELRGRLDLDSGYLSRLLRSLEAAGLVTVVSKDSDRRVRIARLTPAGAAERAVLDERSDDLAASLLSPLSAGQRARLVAAMTDVERLLTAAMIDVAPVDPSHPHARSCVQAYFSELDRRFETGFDTAVSTRVDDDALRPPSGLMLLASLRGHPVGCGGLRLHGNGPAEIKRMWVDESARGLGVGRRLLAALESCAAGRGAPAVRLETNGSLVEAISLYRSTGYAEVEPFNDEAYAHHWFEKPLPAPAG